MLLLGLFGAPLILCFELFTFSREGRVLVHPSLWGVRIVACESWWGLEPAATHLWLVRPISLSLSPLTQRSRVLEPCVAAQTRASRRPASCSRSA